VVRDDERNLRVRELETEDAERTLDDSGAFVMSFVSRRADVREFLVAGHAPSESSTSSAGSASPSECSMYLSRIVNASVRKRFDADGLGLRDARRVDAAVDEHLLGDRRFRVEVEDAGVFVRLEEVLDETEREERLARRGVAREHECLVVGESTEQRAGEQRVEDVAARVDEAGEFSGARTIRRERGFRVANIIDEFLEKICCQRGISEGRKTGRDAYSIAILLALQDIS
jgi:hypothetical protein